MRLQMVLAGYVDASDRAWAAAAPRMSQATRVKIGASRLSGMSSARRPLWWRSLVAADVLIVAAFAVVATVEPYHVLGSEGVEIQGFQGLLPTIVVLALRAVVVAGERYLLPVPHGPMMVACARLASLAGFFYIGRWLYERTYSRWDDFLLGGVLGYALVGVAALGLIAFGYSLTRLASAAPRTPRPPADAGPPPGDVPAAPDTAAAPSASPRRGLARDSIIGLVGVFLGVAGLIMGVTSIIKIGVAVVVPAAITSVVAILIRDRSS